MSKTLEAMKKRSRHYYLRCPACGITSQIKRFADGPHPMVFLVQEFHGYGGIKWYEGIGPTPEEARKLVRRKIQQIADSKDEESSESKRTIVEVNDPAIEVLWDA